MSLRSIIFTRENDEGAGKGENITPANGKYENEANTNSKGCVVLAHDTHTHTYTLQWDVFSSSLVVWQHCRRLVCQSSH